MYYPRFIMDSKNNTMLQALVNLQNQIEKAFLSNCSLYTIFSDLQEAHPRSLENIIYVESCIILNLEINSPKLYIAPSTIELYQSESKTNSLHLTILNM